MDLGPVTSPGMGTVEFIRDDAYILSYRMLRMFNWRCLLEPCSWLATMAGTVRPLQRNGWRHPDRSESESWRSTRLSHLGLLTFKF